MTATARVARLLRPAILRLRLSGLATGRTLSDHWGLDRGTPVDRVPIEGFLARHAADVRGDVLEVLDDTYARRLGAGRLGRVDVLDIDATNPAATIVADLCAPDALEAARFDCVILTQVLQYVADPAVALANVRRSLRPGGVLLLTVPSLSRLDARNAAVDRWRFMPAGVELLLGDLFDDVEVDAPGNLTSAAAGLLGLAAEEVGPRGAAREPRFPLVVTARASVRPDAG